LFFVPFTWIFILGLVGINVVLQSVRGLHAMKLAKGQMSLFHLVMLITIQSIQAIVWRISAAAGMLVYQFLRLKSWWLKRTRGQRRDQ